VQLTALGPLEPHEVDLVEVGAGLVFGSGAEGVKLVHGVAAGQPVDHGVDHAERVALAAPEADTNGGGLPGVRGGSLQVFRSSANGR
jgi:hypothetical protein